MNKAICRLQEKWRAIAPIQREFGLLAKPVVVEMNLQYLGKATLLIAIWCSL